MAKLKNRGIDVTQWRERRTTHQNNVAVIRGKIVDKVAELKNRRAAFSKMTSVWCKTITPPRPDWVKGGFEYDEMREHFERFLDCALELQRLMMELETEEKELSEVRATLKQAGIA